MARTSLEREIDRTKREHESMIRLICTTMLEISRPVPQPVTVFCLPERVSCSVWIPFNIHPLSFSSITNLLIKIMSTFKSLFGGCMRRSHTKKID